ncbi:VOC family protein [Paenibacillus lignilyticus]|uniref:VOC family protein n=1 Tax=Paenibacillus lignilyticus TaxID=1172615 RepID=A0ABS5CAT5_9BACL|nr:VOC family protein [Paenibacillus lignilyticus]MBP3963034.1 VOC family protein [Paenibacillus lignilyticus]
MKIIVTSLFVQDQDKALAFYTEMLGFVKKHDIPMGKFRWIALVSSDEQEGTELILEPNDHPAAKEYQKKIFTDGIPATMFGVADIHKEYNRLLEIGVHFTMKPTKMGEFTIAVFDDTCGNLIQMIHK